MKQYWFWGPAILIFMFSACEIKDPLHVDDTSPVLSDLEFARQIYLYQDNTYPLSVKVDDPDGQENIRLVQLKVHNQAGQRVHTDTLADDGKQGDIIPKDGIYFTRIQLDDFNRRPGIYFLNIYAQDFDGNPALPLSDTLTVLAGSPPQILSIDYQDSMDVTLLRNAFFKIQVNDEDGMEDIDSVYVAVQYPWADQPHLLLILNDEGLEGDSLAGDGQFSMQIDLVKLLTIPAEYGLTFTVVDKDGLKTESTKRKLLVNRENHPPELLEVEAPSAAQLPAEGDVSIVLTCTVDDPQGLDDIQQVWFDSTRPDGTAASGNPFQMYDNGLDGGDETADDGLYTLTIYLPAGTTTGTYTFDFQVKDHGGLESNVISHELTVVE